MCNACMPALLSVRALLTGVYVCVCVCMCVFVRE